VALGAHPHIWYVLRSSLIASRARSSLEKGRGGRVLALVHNPKTTFAETLGATYTDEKPKGGAVVRSEEARIGALVRVGESGLRSEWRGLTGRITERWGAPEYVALDVRLEDGRSQLFWHYELEEVPEPNGAVTEEAPGSPDSRKVAPPETPRSGAP
jgi:hypothetical protein